MVYSAFVGARKIHSLVALLLIFSLYFAIALPEKWATAQSSCNVECAATVPLSGQVGTSVSFTATGSATGCAAAPTYKWDFGDGTPISTQQNTTHAYSSPGAYNWKLTTTSVAGALTIDTVAGGYGDGAQARQASIATPVAVVRDPQGRGIYVVDEPGGISLIRFINTGNSPVTIAGRAIAPGTIRLLAGGGLDGQSEDVPGPQASFQATGIVPSANGDVLYFSDESFGRVRLLNVSSNAVTIGGKTTGVGRISTFATVNGSFSGIAINPTTGEIYFSDATPGTNKVFKLSQDGLNVTNVAGNGANTNPKDQLPQTPVAATSVPLLIPRDIVFDNAGNLFIADSGHARIVQVDQMGRLALVSQLPIDPPSTPNPYPAGLAIVGGNVYAANGNAHTITRVTNGNPIVAGSENTICDYSSSNCGDGGSGVNAKFYLAGSTASPPLVGLESDGAGLYILDQGAISKGRVRYLNLSGGSVTIGGVTIAPGNVETIAGNGLTPSIDSVPAISSALGFPVGVAVDANNNLYLADPFDQYIRFVNRGASAVTIFPNTQAQQTVLPGYIVSINKDVGPGSSDGVPVNTAGFDTPQGLTATNQGLFIADSKKGQAIDGRRTGLIRFVNTTSANVSFFPGSSTPIVVPPGNVATIVGGVAPLGGNGDGEFARNAKLLAPSDIAVNQITGDIYIADVGNRAVRKINGATGVVSSLSLPASQYTGLALDSNNRLYIADYDNNKVLRENNVGSGAYLQLNTTALNKPRDAAVDTSGNVYVTNSGDHRIARISPTGAVEFIAGSTQGFEGDGGAASAAKINIDASTINIGGVGVTVTVPTTVNIAVGTNGAVFFTDTNNNRIRRIGQNEITCIKTGTITIQGNNPIPALTSLSPNSALQGSGSLALTVNGSNFVPSSVVRWNGADRVTTYMSSSQVTAAIPAGDIANAGNANVTVFSPSPGGGTSNALTFAVTQPNPVPAITNISPSSAFVGSPGFTLTVNGTGFVNSSVVRWDDQNRATTFVNSTQLTAQILTTDLQGTGQASVTVFNPAPGGGTSNIVSFTIAAGNNPAPTLTSITPNSAIAGGPDVTLTVNGSNFVGASKVRWNGQDRQTAFVSGAQLVASIPASDVAAAGTAQVAVFTPTPGGGVSASLPFTINTAQQTPPTLTSLSPNRVTAGGPAFTLTVNGANFVTGAAVRINGANRTTTFVNANQITASIPATDIGEIGSLNITAVNPNSGASNSLPLTIVSAVTSVSAASYLGASIAPDSIVAAFGVNLATGVALANTLPLPLNLLGTTVKVRDSAGMEREASLFFVAPQQINYLTPKDTAVGTATVTVAINGNIVAVGQMQVTRVSPGMFSANANGLGVGAALSLKVVNGVQQPFETIFRYDNAQTKFVPVQLDLGPESTQVYLILFGTGFRSNNGLGGVNLKIRGVDVPVLYAGLSPDFAGLDQCNIGPIPRSLIGGGDVDMVLTVEAKVTNVVQVNIK